MLIFEILSFLIKTFTPLPLLCATFPNRGRKVCRSDLPIRQFLFVGIVCRSDLPIRQFLFVGIVMPTYFLRATFPSRGKKIYHPKQNLSKNPLSLALSLRGRGNYLQQNLSELLPGRGGQNFLSNL